MKTNVQALAPGLLALTTLLALVLLGPQTALAQGYTETTLHSFTGARGVHSDTLDGAWPRANLVMDRKGNLFGTTEYGGTSGWGTVFEITAGGVYSTLHSFSGVDGDGDGPEAGLVMDGRGNLFGTAATGGTGGVGVVFEIAAGTNAYSTLHAFTGRVSVAGDNPDGAHPHGVLLLDSRGSLLGTTEAGGTSGNGTVFKITSGGAYSTLHSFTGAVREGAYTNADGAAPNGSLVLDREGTLFGTTAWGGTGGAGTVFEITPTGAYSTLHSFTGNLSPRADGQLPAGSLVLDSRGSLFGTTRYGGPTGNGTVFALIKTGAAYTEVILHAFPPTSGNPGGKPDGIQPQGGLVMDSRGNLFGTTSWGGTGGRGTVFEITPGGVFSALYSFSAPKGGNLINADGIQPQADLLLDGRGNVFGTTNSGGLSGQGTVFEISPSVE